MTKTRNTNIEILRLVLMMSIFCWHILVHGFGFKDINSGGYMYNENIGIVLSSLFAPATYCFMFISGYYGMKFSVKKIASMEIWLIVVSVITAMADMVFFNSGGLRMLFSALFPVSTLRWWFMTCYMLLFLLTPIFNKGIECLSKTSFRIILFSLIVYQVISILRLQSNGGSNFLGLLTMFLLARYCKIYAIEFKKHVALIAFLLVWGLQIVLMMGCNKFSQHNVFVLLNYNTPFIMIMAIMLFYFVKNMKPRYSSGINKCLKPTLFIYLVTDGLFVPFYKWIVLQLNVNCWMGIGISIVTIIGSLLIGRVVMHMTEKVLAKCRIQKLDTLC